MTRESPQQPLDVELTEAARSRRGVLAYGASLATLAALQGCRRPEERIVPRARNPEYLVPGNPVSFATSMSLMGTAVGLSVESMDCRPTKIEGNPRHPASHGATNAALQASILELYDPERSRHPLNRGNVRSWEETKAFLRVLGDRARGERRRSLVVVTRCYRSPTLNRVLALLEAELPGARRIEYEPFDDAEQIEGMRIAFGHDRELVPEYGKASALLALGADPFGLDGDSLRAARGWAARRSGASGTNRVYVVESSLTISGAVADHRFVCRPSELPGFLAAAALELARQAGWSVRRGLERALARAGRAFLEGSWPVRIGALTRDLVANPGESLVVVGRKQAPEVHALGHWMNEVLGNVPSTARYVPCVAKADTGIRALAELANRLTRGQVQTVLLLGTNPVYDAPGDLDLAGALGHAQNTVHLGLYQDETAQACAWHVNEAHPLEAWSDTVALDGTAGIAQPLIAPLWNGRTAAELVNALLGRDETAHQLVRGTWQGRLGVPEFERRWRQALSEGVVGDDMVGPGATADSSARAVDVGAVADAWERRQGAPAEGVEVGFSPDPHSYDGRFANNAWLHELPEPITKVTWGNPARLSKPLAERYGVETGDWVRLRSGTRVVEIPVVVTPGEAPETITLTIGQGRRSGGTIGRSTGFDVGALRSVASPFQCAGVSVERLGRTWQMARAQKQFSAQGRSIVRTSRAGGAVAREGAQPAEGNPSALQSGAPPGGQAWGMSIDLAKCTGCGACVVACQAENNVPVVGRREIRRGGPMHWLRIDRYFSESGAEPLAVAQPVPCQHCERAPCEAVCPVGATTHSPEGLNEMVYSRCIGSRYCANNCPYSVRRFNFFDNASGLGSATRMRLNPEVTVRTRGVMEKCTFCVQRINRARVAAKREGRRAIRDREVRLACEQACPTGAIVFGDLNDARSRIFATVRDQRAYRLLDDLGTQPRVVYLSRVTNPNPELA